MKKLAIAGAQELTRDNTPWDDAEYDIWAISSWVNAEWCKRADAVIEVHIPEIYTNHPRDAEYWDWLQANTTTTVYMRYIDQRVPMAELYPLDEVRELIKTLTWKGNKVRNLCSTVDYALALALYQGYKEIEIYGIEMAHSSEYRSQQASFSFWVGVAAGMGVNVELRCTRGLFDKPLYGNENFMHTEKLRKYIDGMKIQKEQAEKQVVLFEGALQFAQQLLSDEENETEPEAIDIEDVEILGVGDEG